MTDAGTKDSLFPPMRLSPQSKAEITNSTARAIIKAETESREAKTLRLRQARLEMEARQSKRAPAKRGALKKKKSSPSAAPKPEPVLDD